MRSWREEQTWLGEPFGWCLVQQGSEGAARWSYAQEHRTGYWAQILNPTGEVVLEAA
jgi:hypothetical protein